MSTISNKFFIQILEDGSSLHGQLLSTITPSQSYKDGQFIPNWATTASARPMIYLSLQNGNNNIQPDSGYVWSYNGQSIAFSGTQTTETIGDTTYNGYKSVDGGAGYASGVADKFFKTSYNGMPALGIISNIASSSNVDVDVIRFDGTVTLTSNPVGFSAFTNITITQWTSGGYQGVLSFPNGNEIRSAGQTLGCVAKLFNDSGEITNPQSGTPIVEYKWYYEGNPTVQGTGATFNILESAVTDFAIVRCDFYITINGTRTLVASAFGQVDDKQDPEYMWIMYNGTNGNGASLRANESVTMSICIGTPDDPTPNTAWTSFKVKLIDSDGVVIQGTSQGQYTPQNDSVFHITADASDEYRRTLPVNAGVATAKVYYDDVVNMSKKGLTGYVVAETGSNV